MKIQKETFQFGKALTMSWLAKEYYADIIRSQKVKGTAKRFINDVIGRHEYVFKNLNYLLPEESANVMKEQLLNDEMTLQMDSIFEMLLQLPKGIKDDIESYIEQRFNVYKINK